MTLNSRRVVAKFVGTAAELKAQCEEVLGISRRLAVVCDCTKLLRFDEKGSNSGYYVSAAECVIREKLTN